MAHTAAVPVTELPPDATLPAVDSGVVDDELAFDHADMVRLAVDDLRARYAAQADPDRLLGDEFTVLDLRRLYEVVFDRSLQKDSFRRHVVDALDTTGRLSHPGQGRPAELFRRRGRRSAPGSGRGPAHRPGLTEPSAGYSPPDGRCEADPRRQHRDASGRHRSGP